MAEFWVTFVALTAAKAPSPRHPPHLLTTTTTTSHNILTTNTLPQYPPTVFVCPPVFAFGYPSSKLRAGLVSTNRLTGLPQLLNLQSILSHRPLITPILVGSYGYFSHNFPANWSRRPAQRHFRFLRNGSERHRRGLRIGV